ncbi:MULTISPECIES: DUF3631 domain-containing protein [unclassified Sinorhizobium]|uniref:DUF3631 domain-containing protein n=1 Tax=unclassified Sinorhizobium TaxID=2613772 RepID=UPI0024C3BA0D|nr:MULTISPECIES: DUF3631 domain-containing protein [unclassified Sinorhizobium]MDK1376147.1 DUF3631 domain-containing protein [Sinorhizobium sp. 6-70]MDK1480316.1 DUF3631 domain-containing protein [Sinorhizobium sp. 6-117]
MAKHDDPREPDEIKPDSDGNIVHIYKPKAKIDGAALLDDIAAFLARFVVYPDEHALVAHTLWIAHCWFMDCWESTPRIAFISPEAGSGKTRSLELTAPMVPNPLQAATVTPAYLFRKIGSEDRPTLLYDEIDTVFGPRVKKDNEEIRALLNAGHRRGAVSGRCALKGKKIITEEFPAYCAVALAGLGHLPETLLTRSVIIPMRKRAADETIEPYRCRFHEPQARALGERLEQWAKEIMAEMEGYIPEMPGSVFDRNADVWEALLAVADKAGKDWPDRARGSAVALVAASKDKARSLGVQLLSDIRDVFGETTEKIATKRLIERLCDDFPESPWSDLKGKPLTANKLAAMLKMYGIASRNVRLDASDAQTYEADYSSTSSSNSSVLKGYRKEDFHDAWKRYLS